jgi:hypothetical protein
VGRVSVVARKKESEDPGRMHLRRQFRQVEERLAVLPASSLHRVQLLETRRSILLELARWSNLGLGLNFDPTQTRCPRCGSRMRCDMGENSVIEVTCLSGHSWFL